MLCIGNCAKTGVGPVDFPQGRRITARRICRSVRATFDIYVTIQPEILSHIMYHIQAVQFKKTAWMWYIIPAKIAHPKVSEDARKAYPGSSPRVDFGVVYPC